MASMRRLIKKHGDLKVSEEASEELRRVVGDYGSRIAEAAVAQTLFENRRTVLARDIQAARRRVEGAGADR